MQYWSHSDLCNTFAFYVGQHINSYIIDFFSADIIFHAEIPATEAAIILKQTGWHRRWSAGKYL